MATCPSCGDKKAEIGLVQCYCPNPKCEHFDKAQLDLVVADAEEKYDDTFGPLPLQLIMNEFYD